MRLRGRGKKEGIEKRKERKKERKKILRGRRKQKEREFI